ncbi:MAG: heme o synthase [Parvibaculales bacterium]
MQKQLQYDEVLGGTARDYFQLLKPRVMSLVVFTAFVGLVLAPNSLHPVLGVAAILLITIGAGAAGALNQALEGDIDALMPRTKLRPVARGVIKRQDALAFGLVLSFGAVMMMGVFVNWLAAFLLGFTIFFYAVIYTLWLKPSTPQNIVIGGAAGALPPVIGWACVENSLSFEPLILFAIIFLWTPPHFWALAILRKSEYAPTRLPMLPLTHGDRATAKQCFFYALLLFLCSLLPIYFGMGGVVYLVAAPLLGVVFVFYAWRLWHGVEGKRNYYARALFRYSILYLFLVFALLLAPFFVSLL